MASTSTPPTETTRLQEDALASSQNPGKRSCGSWAATAQLIGASGAGLVADGYDLQVVNLVIAIVQHLYPDKMDPTAKSFAATMTLVGVVLGQVSFGAFADIVGRKLASMITAGLTIVGAALSACVRDSPGFGIAVQLGLCRLLLGLGIGGEYPLSAALGKEAAGKDLCCTRSQMLVSNMVLFNVGSTIQAAFVLIMLQEAVPLSWTWRLALAGGVVPSLVAASLRLNMEEPQAVVREARANQGANVGFQHYFTSLRSQVGARWQLMLGACLSWFLFNFTAYGHGAFSSIICDRLLGQKKDGDMLAVIRNAVFALIMGTVGLVANLSGFVLERALTRKHLQLFGFFLMATPLFVIGIVFGRVSDKANWLLSALYMTCVFAMPLVGITTYLIPAECIPASARGTCVGIAAASGKVGGMVGTALFPICEAAYGLNFVLLISGFVSLLGAFVTVLLTPHSGIIEDGIHETPGKSVS
eukprot:CAMPEP_0171074170 /NCGR_PEP_ID=MMETSP0766_2-20121228/11967_1 /TAXON_ID=439317 /ORGANISM="Gambierdiscus australes, Strain CAWD 149" /LENGTH=472 /DNA_ID=CAMNT_0011530933 /DNA_START=27 /DNA_END=1445 /DNA_ORIENTATION=+